MKNAVKLSVPLEIDMKQGNNWLKHIKHIIFSKSICFIMLKEW